MGSMYASKWIRPLGYVSCCEIVGGGVDGVVVVYRVHFVSLEVSMTRADDCYG